MTTANMKLVVVNVPLEDKMETPEAKLEAGEFIVTRVVELAKLNDELKGEIYFIYIFISSSCNCAVQHMTIRCECMRIFIL